jgi:hypothetical protein
MGVWASWDRGAHWASLRGDLPVVQVRDIRVHPRENDILLATHGRGLYILDDATPLQQLRPAMQGDVTLFDVRPAVRWGMWSRDGNLGQKKWSGENPPEGALVTYYLKTQPAGPVDVIITDEKGQTVRRLRRVSDEAGVNRTAWDLRYDPPFQAPGAAGGQARAAGAANAAGATGGAGQRDADTSLAALRARRRAEATSDREGPSEFEGFNAPTGQFVLPGTYTVTLAADGKRLTKTVKVEMDPRSDMTQAQLVAQFDAATQMRELTSRVNRLLVATDDVLRQLTSLQDQLRRAQRPGATDSASVVALASSGAPTSPALREVDSTLKELKHFRDSVLARPLQGLGYRQYPRLREEIQTVTGMVTRPMKPPTAGETLRMGELKSETDQAQARLDAIIQNRVGKINQLLAGTPHVIAPTRPAAVIP